MGVNRGGDGGYTPPNLWVGGILTNHPGILGLSRDYLAKSREYELFCITNVHIRSLNLVL